MFEGLKLEELAEQTGISKSALGSYEKDDYKEINHVIIALTPKVSGSFVCCPEHATKVNAQMNIHNAIIIFFIISSSFC